jgi:hypothetical protein
MPLGQCVVAAGCNWYLYDIRATLADPPYLKPHPQVQSGLHPRFEYDVLWVADAGFVPPSAVLARNLEPHPEQKIHQIHYNDEN